MSILVVPDPHAKPGVSPRRFDWLGKLIYDLRPKTVVCMGDFADMESLCTYDRGKKGFEGRRYSVDIDAARSALERVTRQFKHHKKKHPRLVMLEGNHEHRIHRAVECDPILDGTIGLVDLGYEQSGWELVKYRGATPGIIDIDGISFAHFFTSGVMGRAISGEHPGYQIIMKKHKSCVGAHSHVKDYCERNDANRKRIQAWVSGCYLDPKQEEGYAGEANSMWWRGVLHLIPDNNGSWDYETIGIERIKKTYG